jgi:hypothetical protein
LSVTRGRLKFVLFLDCCLISPKFIQKLVNILNRGKYIKVRVIVFNATFKNISVIRVCYSRNTSCTINLISKFLLSTHRIWKYIIQRIFKVHCIFFGNDTNSTWISHVFRSLFETGNSHFRPETIHVLYKWIIYIYTFIYFTLFMT